MGKVEEEERSNRLGKEGGYLLIKRVIQDSQLGVIRSYDL